jgi:hypothetical protein
MTGRSMWRRAVEVPHRGRWLAVLGLAVVAGVLAGALLLLGGRNGSEAQPVGQAVAASIWPPFTIVYTVRDIDPVTGELVIDQTSRAVVEDNYTWRSEVIRDGINPDAVGSYRELRDGVLVEYNAHYGETNRTDVGQGSVVPITEELSPVTLASLRRGRGPVVGEGWTQATARAPGRVTFEQSATVPCVPESTPAPAQVVPTPAGPPPPGVVRPKVLPRGPLLCTGAGAAIPVERRIEFDERNSRPTYDRGIAIFGEQRINGVVVHTYTVESLDINWPAQTATPDVPQGIVPSPTPR